MAQRRRDPRAAARSASTRWSRLPDAAFTRAALERLDFFVAIDFFMSETARHADLVLPGSLHEEDEGTVTSTEGRVIRIRQAVRTARRGAARLADHLRPRAAARRRGATSTSTRRERSSTSCGAPRAAASPTTPASPTKRSSSRWACSGRARRPSIPARRGCSKAGASTMPTAGRASTRSTTARRPKTSTTSTRSCSRPGGSCRSSCRGTQTRRIGPLVDAVPGAACRDASAPGGAARRHRRRRSCASSAGAAISTLPALVVATIRPDTVFIPYHWPGEQSANRLTQRAYDPIAKIPEFKVSAVRVGARWPHDRRALHRSATLHRLPRLRSRRAANVRGTAATR